MKLIKHTATKVEGSENYFTTSEVMTSNDLDALKYKANELCQLMRVKPSAWTSRHPIMGNNPIKSNTEWIMILDNDTALSIEI